MRCLSCNHNRNHLDNKLLPAVATPDMWSINPPCLIYDQGSKQGPSGDQSGTVAPGRQIQWSWPWGWLQPLCHCFTCEFWWRFLSLQMRTEHNHLGVPFLLVASFLFMISGTCSSQWVWAHFVPEESETVTKWWGKDRAYLAGLGQQMREDGVGELPSAFLEIDTKLKRRAHLELKWAELVKWDGRWSWPVYLR